MREGWRGIFAPEVATRGYLAGWRERVGASVVAPMIGPKG